MTTAVWIALFATMASTVSSIAALVISGRNLGLAQKAYTRTEDRYRDDRRDAHDAQLRDAVIAVSMAVHSYTQALAWYGKLLMDFINPQSKLTTDTVNKHDVNTLRPAAGQVYRAILIVEFLTSDDRLITITDRIKRDLVEATKAANTFKPTIQGTRGVAIDLKRIRNDVAEAASELIDVAQVLLLPPPALEEGPQSTQGDITQ